MRPIHTGVTGDRQTARATYETLHFASSLLCVVVLWLLVDLEDARCVHVRTWVQ